MWTLFFTRGQDQSTEFVNGIISVVALMAGGWVLLKVGRWVWELHLATLLLLALSEISVRISVVKWGMNAGAFALMGFGAHRTYASVRQIAKLQTVPQRPRFRAYTQATVALIFSVYVRCFSGTSPSLCSLSTLGPRAGAFSARFPKRSSARQHHSASSKTIP